MIKSLLVAQALISTIYAVDQVKTEKVVVPQASEENSVVPFKMGAGVKMGSDGYGVNARAWYNQVYGLSFHYTNSWNNEVESSEAYFNYRLPFFSKYNPYLFAGGGASWINLDEGTTQEENVRVNELSLGLGLETFLDKYKVHSISLEAALHHGVLEYRSENTSELGVSTQTSEIKEHSLTPISGKLLYHYYFYPVVERDLDGDGLIKTDKCPQQAEDMDGYEDSDGCPELDNDSDGILDLKDVCPLIAEDKDGFEDTDGCLDVDNDADGILDVEDKCPLVAEDVDGFEDTDGCLDTDNDADGILDEKDKCPLKAENINEFEDADGCPDVKVEPKAVIKQALDSVPVKSIGFELGKVVLLSESSEALDQLVGFMNEYKSVVIEVQGHTDDLGRASWNKTLSQKRAEAVLEYLVAKSIDTERITAVGYGPDQPIADNKTRAGRALNRRVEIVVSDK